MPLDIWMDLIILFLCVSNYVGEGQLRGEMEFLSRWVVQG